jgi:hypothetical protein
VCSYGTHRSTHTSTYICLRTDVSRFRLFVWLQLGWWRFRLSLWLLLLRLRLLGLQLCLQRHR